MVLPHREIFSVFFVFFGSVPAPEALSAPPKPSIASKARPAISEALPAASEALPATSEA